MGSIQVEGLGKAYKQYSTRWGRLKEWLLPQAKVQHQLRWVIRGVTFAVRPGESVGIVGMNGAGKSTLLKLITGTTQPTAGSVAITGRVAALLELGMGFHPDFTGRQNVVMAGQLLGYGVDEISDLMPTIEAFAEIGDYINQPVRIYSSGMQVRLAFSVATARRPDVLIVDEALSVGDTYFQHKSFERIRSFREQGTTLLIVSHDKQAIQTICDRAILLSHGQLAMEGEPEAVMDYYNAMLADQQNQQVSQVLLPDGRTQTISGTGEITFGGIGLFNQKGEKIEIVAVGEQVSLRIKVKINKAVPSVVLGCGIKDRLGQMMFGTNTFHTKQKLLNPEMGSTYLYTVAFAANLGVGSYSVHLSLVAEDSHIHKNYEWRDNVLVFEVVNLDKIYFVGSNWNQMDFNFEKMQ